MPKSRVELARLIDHTLLKPEATAEQVDRLCEECLRFEFAAACVNPCWVPRCVGRLTGSTTVVASVAGFPLGASATPVKAYEALVAIDNGAREVDMVVNLGALIAGERGAVLEDICAVVDTVKRGDADAIVKVILETAALSGERIRLGCECCVEAGADFVKTSTGFHPAGGATVEHVTLLREYAQPLKVKAAGGIRDLPTAMAMIEAGAERLGMSASVSVMEAMKA